MDALDYGLIALAGMIVWLLFTVTRDLHTCAKTGLVRAHHQHSHGERPSSQHRLSTEPQPTDGSAFAPTRAMP